ncbi:MAG TPA: hypothetical protein VIM58_09565, partial [Candidatus Methylacidiphilales bacterium]
GESSALPSGVSAPPGKSIGAASFSDELEPDPGSLAPSRDKGPAFRAIVPVKSADVEMADALRRSAGIAEEIEPQPLGPVFRGKEEIPEGVEDDVADVAEFGEVIVESAGIFSQGEEVFGIELEEQDRAVPFEKVARAAQDLHVVSLGIGFDEADGADVQRGIEGVEGAEPEGADVAFACRPREERPVPAFLVDPKRKGLLAVGKKFPGDADLLEAAGILFEERQDFLVSLDAEDREVRTTSKIGEGVADVGADVDEGRTGSPFFHGRGEVGDAIVEAGFRAVDPKKRISDGETDEAVADGDCLKRRQEWQRDTFDTVPNFSEQG